MPFQNPPVWSFTPQFDSFVQLWQATNFAQVLGNTAIVAVLSTIVSLLIGAPAAYAFARYTGRIGPILLVLALVFRALPRFRGRAALLPGVLGPSASTTPSSLSSSRSWP